MKTWNIALVICLVPVLGAADDAFDMPVMDVFAITGKGIVATGRIESGSVAKGDGLCLVSESSGAKREIIVIGIEQFRKILESASEGENVGLLLEGVEKGDVARGDRLLGEC